MKSFARTHQGALAEQRRRINYLARSSVSTSRAPNCLANSTTISGSSSTVAEKRTLGRLSFRTPDEEVVLTLDGQVRVPICPEDRILIRKSLTTFKIVQPMNRNYFEVLREKLRWGK